MVNGIERPLDVLNNAKGKDVLVQLKNNRQMVGILLAFDIHINVVLDNAKEILDGEEKRSIGLTFLRGDTIIFISPASVAKWLSFDIFRLARSKVSNNLMIVETINV